ncbi:hypothetical protein LEP1GSC052_1567 [Leptospira kmetyi serovar Malaysia str. Bejo-Iso9]|nr:hypothetical protein LEP1GSC052_1567 [Leptospira kmetyi serovar Malaysia str. Bejo-Iso9]
MPEFASRFGYRKKLTFVNVDPFRFERLTFKIVSIVGRSRIV